MAETTVETKTATVATPQGEAPARRNEKVGEVVSTKMDKTIVV
jgi:hypothetical protein